MQGTENTPLSFTL